MGCWFSMDGPRKASLIKAALEQRPEEDAGETVDGFGSEESIRRREQQMQKPVVERLLTR